MTFADLLDLSVDEIAHWGADGVQTPRRLAAMFADLEPVATEDHRVALRAKADAGRAQLKSRSSVRLRLSS